MLQQYNDKCLIQLIKEKKSATVSSKILSSTTVFNIDKNNKYFLSTKSAY